MQRGLLLTLMTFSKTGGIEKACRSLISAISKNAETKLTTWSLYDKAEAIDERYTENVDFKAFNGKQLKFGFQTIFNTQKYDYVILSHINLLLFGKIIKLISPKTKIILWAHGIEVWRPLPAWKVRFLKTSVETWAVSNFTKRTLCNKHSIPEENIKVVHNTLDPMLKIPTDFRKSKTLLERYKLKDDSFIFFSLTRLSSTEHLKNYDKIITIIKKLKDKYPNLIYLLGGKADQKEYNRIHALITDSNLQDYVKLIGFVEDAEVSAHFSLSDCFILPSQKEGFGIVFIEAAAHGCQVIGGNVDGSTDALLDGKLGQLVNPNSENEIRLAMENALNNETHSHLMQQEMTLKNFGFNVYVNNIRRILNPELYQNFFPKI